SRIGRARVRTDAAASPAAETVTYLSIIGWCCSNRDNCSTVFPPAGGTDRATRSGGHRQVILRRECRCVSLIRGRRNSVRDRSVVAPPRPYVPHARGTVLRRRCSNGVTRTGRPGKRLCRNVTSAVNSERETGGRCLNRHLNGRRGTRCRSGRRG